MIKIREASVKYSAPKLIFEKFSGPDSVHKFLLKILRGESREHFVSIYLDAVHKPIAYSINHVGTANSCNVHPREVLQPAVMLGAVAFIVAHNHPSGECEPSPEDRKVTRQLSDAGKILGIKLLDHLVVTDKSYYSFQEHDECN